MGNIAIIPARGGSKRIPRKNIKNFLGKNIIAYSIEAALKSKLFDEVMVSTDDDEIANIALGYGAKVPYLRSEKNSSDFATTFEVIDEVINFYEQKNKYFENICCLYACAPFVTSEKLISAFNELIEKDYDSVFPVVEFGFPIQRALKIEDNKIRFFQPENELKRSQDLEKSYHDAGQFYWMKTEKLLFEKKIVTENTGFIFVSELESQDIDNEVDWKLAELKFKLNNAFS
jgi:pseudaminic acid cytidylyltransferase